MREYFKRVKKKLRERAEDIFMSGVSYAPEMCLIVSVIGIIIVICKMIF